MRVTRVRRARAIDDAPPRLCVARRRRSCVVVRASARHPSSSARPVSRRRRERTSERPNVTHENIFARDRPTDRSIDRSIRAMPACGCPARDAGASRAVYSTTPRTTTTRTTTRTTTHLHHTNHTPRIDRPTHHITSHPIAPIVRILRAVLRQHKRRANDRDSRQNLRRPRAIDRPLSNAHHPHPHPSWALGRSVAFEHTRAQGQGLSANRDQGRARPHTPDARETPHIDRAIDARDR